jgi:ABC-type arginine transport system ATPase subunit
VQGLGYVPQGRRLFSELTVEENLVIGLMTRKSSLDAMEAALVHFPVLRERLRQRAGTLSGGEQSMLAVARSLCTEPSILLLDEPTEGLMPSMVVAIRDVIGQLRDKGVGVSTGKGAMDKEAVGVYLAACNARIATDGGDALTELTGQLSALSVNALLFGGISSMDFSEPYDDGGLNMIGTGIKIHFTRTDITA